MSVRGKFGPPFRAPGNSGGWPNTVLQYGDCYQNRNKTTEPRYQNTTQQPLAHGLYGRPDSRAARDNTVEAGLPCPMETRFGLLPMIPWIGLGDDQYLLSDVPNQFTLNLTTDFEKACHVRGFKNVLAQRQWHGAFDWLSHDGGTCNDTICGADVRRIEVYQPTPSSTKYLTWTATNVVANINRWDSPGLKYTTQCAVDGSISVDASSGKISNGVVTSQYDYAETSDGMGGLATVLWRQSVGGAGFQADVAYPAGQGQVNYGSGMTTDLDLMVCQDLHCGTVVTPSGVFDGLGADLEASVYVWNGLFADQLPRLATNINSYSGSASDVVDFGAGVIYTRLISISWTRTATDFTWSYAYSFKRTDGGGPQVNAFEVTYSGTISLSGANPFSSVKADCENLLNYWPLNDDIIYPWRNDSIWGMAPKMTRDERGFNQSPLTGFLPATMDDYSRPKADGQGRSPFTYSDTLTVTPTPYWNLVVGNKDDSGLSLGDLGYDETKTYWTPTWEQIAWYDAGAYGFRFPYGRNSSNSASTDSAPVQYALTGKIFGMPMPRAFHDTDSALNQGGGTFGSLVSYQDFFDHRANVWRAANCSGYYPYYVEGYGQWLTDIKTVTGAQLPSRCTQWSNAYEAMTRSSYAYIIGADRNTYDKSGTPGPSSDYTAQNPDALVMQKCCVALERWPSENFFRPAGDDRFSFDESRVFCATNLAGSGAGSTWTLTDSVTSAPPASGYPVAGEIWGGKSVAGFYTVSAYNVGTGVVTLGAKSADVPTNWTTLFGDDTTAFGKLLYFTKPPILGRALIKSVTDNHDGTLTIETDEPQYNIITTDQIDFYAVSYPLAGITPCETMTAVGTTKTVTRVDDTHFKITAALSDIAGTTYIQSHGAPKWFWDDTRRKGDFVAHQWTWDYRTNQERSRLLGVTDCSGHNPPTDSPGTPAANNQFSAWEQLALSVRTTPCYPAVVCISPNVGDVFQTGYTLGVSWIAQNLDTGAFRNMANSSDLQAREVVAQRPYWPTTFAFDERYGARWQAEIEQAMQTLWAQTPHHPCGDPSTSVGMDDGSCQVTYTDGSGTHYIYAHTQFVEARIAPPNNGGCAQNETAPTPPVTMGYLSPVTTTGAGVSYPPGQIGFYTGAGMPLPDWSYWQYRMTIETNCPTCAYNYADLENFDCVDPADIVTQDDGPPAPPFSGLGGLS